MTKHGVTREAFLKFDFPILPYCEERRGPSTQFNESVHIQNRDTGISLNFYWRNDNTVSVGKTNSKEKNMFKKFDTVLATTSEFNQDIIIDLCKRFLSCSK